MSEKPEDQMADSLMGIDARMSDIQTWMKEIHIGVCNKANTPMYDMIEELLAETKKTNKHLEAIAESLRK